jgi:hypothetical protein
MTLCANRINQLARELKAKTYLEIGVSEGHTFLKVEIDERTGVDPRFRFETAPHIDARTRLIEETSDVFFASLASDTTFDIILIDGLHVFEQVVRDFTNSVLHSNPKTVFIIDDTFPSDAYSAIPDVEEMVQFRGEAGFPFRGEWQGDVFKMIPFLHDFWPALNYRTMLPANHQTLVWRSKKLWRTSRFGTLENISKFTFFDLLRNRDLLLETAEQEAIELCISEVLSI